MNTMEDIAKSKLRHATQVGRETLVARTYIYPVKGIFYLLSRPNLYEMIASQITPTIILGFTITVLMFFIAYIPQAAVLTLLNGPLGFINAISLVLSESGTITMLLARNFTLKNTQVDLFDATLVSEGQDTLVSRGRELKAGRGFKGTNALGKSLIQIPSGRSIWHQIVDYIMLLPLNFIPVIGTALFLITQGSRVGPSYHARYFQLKRYDKKRQHEEVLERRGGYIGFGTATVLLNLIPLGTIFFTLGSAVGAALWAADIEKSHQQGRPLSPQLTATVEESDIMK